MLENEYSIKTKPDSPGNRQANSIVERVHKLLGNLVHIYNLQETYVDDTNPWVGNPSGISLCGAIYIPQYERKNSRPDSLW